MLPESAVIMEYLEERYPEPALLAADPADRALARLRIFRHDEVTTPYYAVRRGDDDARGRLDEQLARLDALLDGDSRGSAAREYGLADIAYVPWILRARDMLGVEFDPFPALARLARAAARSGPRSRPSRLSSLRCERAAAGRRRGVARGASRRGRSRRRRRARPERAHARPHSGLAPARARLAAAGRRRARRRRSSRRRSCCVCAGTGSPARSGSCSSTAATPSARCRRRRWPSSPVIGRSRSCSAAIAGWPGELEDGPVELEPVREASLGAESPRAADARRARVAARRSVADDLLDVRRAGGVHGQARQRRATRVRVTSPARSTSRSASCSPAPACRRRPSGSASSSALPDGAEVVAYCHSGSRSALATLALRSAGYDARNYAGSWHEWSRHAELPLER